MRTRAFLIVISIAACGLLAAAPSRADVVGSTTSSTSSGSLPNLPGLGSLPNQDANVNTAAAARPSSLRARAAAPSRGAPTKLPATGAPVGAVALLGVALLAGGLLLVELTPRRA